MTSTIAVIERLKEQSRSVDMFRDQIRAICADAATELTTLLKRCDYWEKQYNEARALAWKTADERDALLERCEKAEAELRDEIKIVDRVWSALCISTYEQAGGKEISEIVADWKERAETAEAEVKELTAERDALKVSLKIYGAHANECSGRYGPECDCGWRELKI